MELPHHPVLSHLDLVLEKRVRLFLLEKLLVPLLVQDDPGLRWGFRRRSPPGRLTVPSVTGNMELSPLIGVNTSVALSLRAWSSDASICSNSSMSAIIMSPFQIPPECNAYPTNIPGKTFGPNWWSQDRSFAAIGWYSTIAPNGITGPMNGFSNRHPQGVFSSDIRSWIFRK